VLAGRLDDMLARKLVEPAQLASEVCAVLAPALEATTLLVFHAAERGTIEGVCRRAIGLIWAGSDGCPPPRALAFERDVAALASALRRHGYGSSASVRPRP
jgi:hypothetical protein